MSSLQQMPSIAVYAAAATSDSQHQMDTNEPRPKPAKYKKKQEIQPRKMPQIEKEKKMSDNDGGAVVVYTDGSCLNEKDLSASGVGLFFGKNHPLNRSIALAAPHDSGRAEIETALKALEIIRGYRQYRNRPVEIRTDYANILAVLKRGIKQHHQLEELMNRLLAMAKTFKMGVKFRYVRAHVNERGNEEADKLARAAVQRKPSKPGYKRNRLGKLCRSLSSILIISSREASLERIVKPKGTKKVPKKKKFQKKKKLPKLDAALVKSPLEKTVQKTTSKSKV